LCTDLDLSLLYILILGTYSKFARKKNFLALGVCFPQKCSSAGRMFAASRSRLQYYRRIFFVSTVNKSMKCVLNWIPLRIHLRSRNTQPHLNAGSGINFSTTFPDSKLEKRVQIFHISRFCSVFQVIQVISSAKFCSDEEVDLIFNSETKEHPQISNPSFQKRDRKNIFLQMF